MRDGVAEHDPAGVRPRDVHHFIFIEAARRLFLQDLQRAHARLVAQNPIPPPRRILGPAEREKQRGADDDPRRVEQPASPPHASYDNDRMARPDIEQTLIEIVKKEKDVPADKLSPERLLTDAGIDSLDALTILFAIEEHFKISIPDDRARAVKTFGDLAAIVEDLVPPS